MPFLVAAFASLAALDEAPTAAAHAGLIARAPWARRAATKYRRMGRAVSRGLTTFRARAYEWFAAHFAPVRGVMSTTVAPSIIRLAHPSP